MKKILFLNVLSLLMAANAAEVSANDDVAGKINRIERRMIALEKQVFSGKSNVNVVSSDNKLLAKSQAKIIEIQEQNAKLYGKVEELGYALEKLTEQLQMMSEDFDYRINELENSATNSGESSVSDATNSDEENDQPKANVANNVEKIDIPQGLTAEAIYEKSYNYLTLTEYDKANQWFTAFIERYPDHSLADNAYYWLGEINLAQGDEKNAIIAFSKGLKSFPSGGKAPANLLKLGSAFKQMGNEKHAINSWNKLIKDFPNTQEATKAKKFLEEI